MLIVVKRKKTTSKADDVFLKNWNRGRRRGEGCLYSTNEDSKNCKRGGLTKLDKQEMWEKRVSEEGKTKKDQDQRSRIKVQGSRTRRRGELSFVVSIEDDDLRGVERRRNECTVVLTSWRAVTVPVPGRA